MAWWVIMKKENEYKIHIKDIDPINLSDNEIYKILLNHEKRISRIEGAYKIIIALLTLNISLSITLLTIIMKVI